MRSEIWRSLMFRSCKLKLYRPREGAGRRGIMRLGLALAGWGLFRINAANLLPLNGQIVPTSHRIAVGSPSASGLTGWSQRPFTARTTPNGPRGRMSRFWRVKVSALKQKRWVLTARRSHLTVRCQHNPGG